LARTEALLKQQEGAATASLERLERKQGITVRGDPGAGGIRSCAASLGSCAAQPCLQTNVVSSHPAAAKGLLGVDGGINEASASLCLPG
jgi:hypothetical protein